MLFVALTGCCAVPVGTLRKYYVMFAAHVGVVAQILRDVCGTCRGIARRGVARNAPTTDRTIQLQGGFVGKNRFFIYEISFTNSATVSRYTPKIRAIAQRRGVARNAPTTDRTKQKTSLPNLLIFNKDLKSR